VQYAALTIVIAASIALLAYVGTWVLARRA
jgi:hypothetical protein